jgi:hypothetical protein
VAGNWTLHYSWAATGSYAQVGIVFNLDGTFTGSVTGTWRQKAGTIMLSFDGGPAKYGGTVNGNIGSGLMSTFSGLDGVWYLSKQGTTGIAPEETVGQEVVQPAHADGNEIPLRELAGAGARRPTVEK